MATEIPVHAKFTVITPSTRVTIMGEDLPLPPDVQRSKDLPPGPANLVTVTTAPIQTGEGGGAYSTTHVTAQNVPPQQQYQPSPPQQPAQSAQQTTEDDDILRHLLYGEGGEYEGKREVIHEESEYNKQIRHWDTYVAQGTMDSPFFARRMQTGVPSEAYIQGVYFVPEIKSDKEREVKEYGPLPTLSYVSAPVVVTREQPAGGGGGGICGFLDRVFHLKCCGRFCQRPETCCEPCCQCC